MRAALMLAAPLHAALSVSAPLHAALMLSAPRVGHRLASSRIVTSAALLRIALGYCQCLSMVRRFLHVRWPRSFIAFLMALDQ